jgi:hypothetical protein
MRRVSEKKAALDAVLAVNRERRRRMANNLCEAGTPACPPGAHVGWHAHHVRRRKGQPDVHAVEHLRWVCWDGHEWVHANPAAARDLGLLA